jgi:hypothetical protein
VATAVFISTLSIVSASKDRRSLIKRGLIGKVDESIAHVIGKGLGDRLSGTS